MVSVLPAKGACGSGSLELGRNLARSAARLRYADLSGPARSVALHCIIDWFGVAIAGAREPAVLILLDQAIEDGGASQASIVGHDIRLSLEQAALLNGTMSHAIDYDDVIMAMRGHPTVAILPAILALAEQQGSSGADVMTALVAGFETACRIGLAVNPGHYDQGWHATSTLGVFGAAAAASNLLRMTEDQTLNALAIAGTQGGGLKASFGTMCKPLHAGRAAATGLKAAQLAKRGFSGSPVLIEGEQGFLQVQAHPADADAARQAPPDGFFITQTLFKRHASCYLTHSAIEAAQFLCATSSLAVEDIDHILVEIDAGHLGICNIARPTTGLELKFSLRAMVALAMLGEDTSDENLYCDATARRADVASLRDRIRIEVRERPSHTLSGVRILLHSGDYLAAERDVGVPCDDLPAQGRALRAKFETLAVPRLGASAHDLGDALESFAEVSDVGEILWRTRFVDGQAAAADQSDLRRNRR